MRNVCSPVPGISSGQRYASTGFTLIEIIVVIALIAIMIGLAAPSFVSFQRNSELVGTANSFLASLSTARAEAMKRNRSAYVIPTDSGGDWSKGWIVFVDMNSSQLYEEGTDLLISEEPALPPLISTPTVTGVNQFDDSGDRYIRFNGSGFPKTKADAGFGAGSIDFSYGGTEFRRVILSPTGRMRVCKPDATTCDPAEQ